MRDNHNPINPFVWLDLRYRLAYSKKWRTRFLTFGAEENPSVWIRIIGGYYFALGHLDSSSWSRKLIYFHERELKDEHRE